MAPVGFNGNVTDAAGVAQGNTPGERIRGDGSFGQLLEAQLASKSDVKISAHAQKRLAERNVQLSENDTARLGNAVDRVQEKGADKSLVLMDDLALLVSARNRVVITAVDSASARDGVFTGIDSAVIA